MINMMRKAGFSLTLAQALLMLAVQAQSDPGCKTEHIAATAPSSRYQQVDKESVLDTETGLMWRICLEGITGESCDEGQPLTLNWAQALAYVPVLNREGGFAGHRDWRLPNIRELSTLLELQCVGPAINRAVFPNMAPTEVWSSSPAPFHVHYSWHVNFATGAFTYGEREKPKAIRLVRDTL